MPDQDTSNSSEGVQLDFGNEGIIGQNDRELFDDENSNYDEDVDILSEHEVVNEDVEKLEDELFCPLYDGATITICGALIAILHFKTDCKLPYTTISKLLMLLKLLCPNDSRLPTSVYMLRKFFRRFQHGITKTEYCPSCRMQKISCTCSNTSDSDTFIQMDLPMQFRSTLSRKS